jgi:hypothetical protein
LQPDGAAPFEMSERSQLSPALSAKNHSCGRTQILNFRQIRTINRHPVASNEGSKLVSTSASAKNISDTKPWLNWNGDLDDPNDSKDDCVADDEFNIEQDNGIQDP